MSAASCQSEVDAARLAKRILFLLGFERASLGAHTPIGQLSPDEYRALAVSAEVIGRWARREERGDGTRRRRRTGS